jgi:hypothetical protein
LLGLAALLVLSACSQDVTTVDSPKAKQILPANSVAACTQAQSVSYLTASIDSLMKILTPNSNSAQSKFQTTLSDLAAGNVSAAQTDLQTLINFINLKYGQVNTTGITIKDPVTGAAVPILQFKDTLLDQLTCYVSLNSFDLNPSDPDKVFPNSDQTAAVFFPHGYVPQGFNVVINTPSSSPLITNLDVYPSFIDIQLLDENGQPPALGTVFNGQPIVVVCFPGTIAPDVAERALLGHQAAAGAAGFELLEKVSIPQALADAVTCGSSLPIQTTALGRLIRKAADFLLPEKVYAAYFGLRGVGGSPEEFSPFGAVDPGVKFGSAGGSPEEFTRTAVKRTPASRFRIASVLVDGGTTVKGVAGSPDDTDPNNLPKVRIATPNGTGLDGIVVTYTLSAPDATGNDPITGPESQATLCGGLSSVQVTTANGGWAQLPCINFGTKVGYKNLKATFDPTNVDPLVCILDAAGLCGPNTTSVNFLVQTIPGAASKIVLVPPPAGGAYGTGLAAFLSVSPNPTVRTTDANDNPVAASVFWQLASTATGASITPAGPWTSDANGLASIIWTLGDGSNGLTAYLGTTATGPSVSFTASTGIVNLAACLASGTTKKTDLAKFVGSGYKGYWSFPSKAKGFIRTANIDMSVTGQSSGTGDYTTTLRAYRKSGSSLGDLIATGKPTTSDQTLKLPGSNNSPTPTGFAMVPSSVVPAVVNVGETVIFELQITAPSTRTFQVWYNTKTTAGTDCDNTILYNPALVTPNFTTSGFLRGLHLKVTN